LSKSPYPPSIDRARNDPLIAYKATHLYPTGLIIGSAVILTPKIPFYKSGVFLDTISPDRRDDDVVSRRKGWLKYPYATNRSDCSRRLIR
jgi:hypothetical protein